MNCDECLKVIPPSIEINGESFYHGETVKVKYLSNDWSTTKIVFEACPKWVGWGSGWYIKDCIGDLRSIKNMDGITKSVCELKITNKTESESLWDKIKTFFSY